MHDELLKPTGIILTFAHFFENPCCDGHAMMRTPGANVKKMDTIPVTFM
jgi:hypothetical protein